MNAPKKSEENSSDEASYTSLYQFKAFDDRLNSSIKKPANILIPTHRPDKALLKNLYPQPINSHEREDGVDHINASDDGLTELGLLLDINAHTPFLHPELGRFASLGGLWLYVRSVQKEDTLRYIRGKNCRSAAKKLQVVNVTGFKTIIAYATWFKIASNQKLVNLMVDSKLPFANYFYFGELRIRRQTSESVWYVNILEEVRRTLKLRNEQFFENGQQPVWPNFSFLEENQSKVD